MSSVQYYLLGSTHLASLLDCLQKYCEGSDQHTTVSWVAGVNDCAKHVGIFRVRLTAGQFMDLTVAGSYYDWLADAREIEVSTETGFRGVAGRRTAGTVDGKFTYTAKLGSGI